MDRFKSKRILLLEQVLSSSRLIRKQKTEVIVWLSCVSWINKLLLSNGSKLDGNNFHSNETESFSSVLLRDKTVSLTFEINLLCCRPWSES